MRANAVARGDVVAGRAPGSRPSWILDVSLDLGDAPPPRRAQIHHGRRETPAERAARRGGCPDDSRMARRRGRQA